MPQATGRSTQAAVWFFMSAHARSRSYSTQQARNEIVDNSIAPLLVEMQEKLRGLRLSAKYELALRGIVINLLQSFIIKLY